MRDGFEQARDLSALGLNTGALIDFFRDNKALDIHALALVRDGRAYALAKRPYRVDSPHTLFSLSKSFCAMAAGLAVAEGLLGYDDSVAEVLADSLPADYDKKLHQVTLHHLLSMSSGLSEASDYGIRDQRDWARAALACKVEHAPGTRFHYNSMGTYLAGRMVARVTGQSLRDYLMPRLFEPLGISKPQWDCCPLGFNAGGFGLHLSVMDLARTASLLLSGGMLDGRQLLPAEFLRRATKKQVDNRNPLEKNPHPDWSLGYGYQFWMARKGRFRGDGMFGQFMMVDRDSKLAVCCTAGEHMMGNQVDALHRLMDGLVQKAQPVAAGALQRLEKRLAVRAPRDDGGILPDLEGSYEDGNGKSLRVEIPDENSLRLYFKAKDDPVPHKLCFGRGRAHRGEFMPWPKGERPQPYLGRFAVQGGTLVAQVVMPEAPYRLLARLSLSEKGLTLETEAIGFDSGTSSLVRTDRP